MDMSLSIELEDVGGAKNKMLQKKTWIFDRCFNSELEALNHIHAEGCWSLKYTNQTLDGQIKYFRCNRVLGRGPQCSSALKLIVPADPVVVLHRTEADHDCDSIVGKQTFGLSPQVKANIQDLYRKKFKPKAIHAQLNELHPDRAIKITQVRNYMAQLRNPKRRSPAENVDSSSDDMSGDGALRSEGDEVQCIASSANGDIPQTSHKSKSPLIGSSSRSSRESSPVPEVETSIDHIEMFLYSLVPNMDSMSSVQLRTFKIRLLEMIDEILATKS